MRFKFSLTICTVYYTVRYTVQCIFFKLNLFFFKALTCPSFQLDSDITLFNKNDFENCSATVQPLLSCDLKNTIKKHSNNLNRMAIWVHTHTHVPPHLHGMLLHPVSSQDIISVTGKCAHRYKQLIPFPRLPLGVCSITMNNEQ